jgi:hypothetical protein
LCLPTILCAQNIKGKIYDSKGVLNGIKITNTNSNSTTISNDKGEFNIQAKPSDSLVFESMFHEPYTLKILPSHFEDILVIELKTTVNQLDEVMLSNTPKAKPFTAESYQTNLQNQILEDIKKHPYKYSKAPSGNIDFVAIAKLLGKLFKRKHSKLPNLGPISYKQIDSLFKKDELFNDSLLLNTLNIPKDAKFLFFEYCEAKNISNLLILNNNRLQLLEEFHQSSLEFLSILKSIKKN